MKKYISKENGKKRGLIEQDNSVGFYLYIFDLKTQNCTHDYLENSFFEAKQKAKEDFSIKMDSWEIY